MRAGEELFVERVAGCRDKNPDVVVNRSVAMDQPVAQTAAAQLVVAASRGRGPFSGLLLGSTSQAMIYHAPCPVPMVRDQVAG